MCFMTNDDEQSRSERSLNDAATFAGAAKPRPAADMSLGDERTLGGGEEAGGDTVIDDIEVVDLEARYRIEGTLGQGGMGAVLLATDTRLGRKVAIKRILGEAAGNRMAVQRFLTEAKSIAALNHANIVQIYDYGRAKDGPFLIMEYVDGGSLLDRCRKGAVPLEEAIDLACQICDGLAKAHDQQIIHRDIKPANVLLTTDGIPKLTDFGLAKHISTSRHMTVTNAVMGTTDFMAPEQAAGAGDVDHRSDIWSLAVTIYQMVTGTSPKIIRFDLLPGAVTKALGKALQYSKEDRYQTARELQDALKSARHAVPKPAGTAKIEGLLQEGQCKACDTFTSDLTKKFCRNPQCGASLRVACLQCNCQIPVWDGVCGECGGNQPTLLEVRRQTLVQKRQEAEAKVTNLAFEDALALARELAAESRPELADIAQWARDFATATQTERHRHVTAAAEQLRDAEKHLAMHDYPAAIQAIEMIPAVMRDAAAKTMLVECQARREQSDALIVEISGRISRKEIDGLLPLVERAAELRRDRPDLAKILQQLTDRRNRRLSQARAAMDSGEVKAAESFVAGAVPEDFDNSGVQFLEQVWRLAELERRLVCLVEDANADGVITPQKAALILELGETYLRLQPGNDKVQALVSRCRHIAGPPFIRNSIGVNLTLIPAGNFTMGTVGNECDQRPHRVTLTKRFYLGIYTVTNAQWKRVMGGVPSKWKGNDCPVEQVSWEDANEFCRQLSALPEEKKAGRMYRLPTEAEWEYACRAGTTTSYSFGDEESQLVEYGWFDRNSGNKTHAVGTKKPNAWGLFDMHGNVWEWCNDWYGGYPRGAVVDPRGPSWETSRVIRGGSWGHSSWSCKSAARGGSAPSNRFKSLGFRIALSPSGD